MHLLDDPDTSQKLLLVAQARGLHHSFLKGSSLRSWEQWQLMALISGVSDELAELGARTIQFSELNPQKLPELAGAGLRMAYDMMVKAIAYPDVAEQEWTALLSETETEK